jgi:3-oxoacyl-[acyl-carrier protein] reductase
METSKKLSGQRAVITGASRGIGAAIARRLAALGAHVVLTARDGHTLREVEQTIAAAGGSAEAHTFDLADAAQIAALAETALRGGPCSILVNNAGTGRFGAPLHTMDVDSFDRLMAVNLRAPYLLLRAFAPSMIAAGSGHIINISSLASRNPVPNGAAYAGAKAGLNGMMISAAEELRQHQVRVSLVEPGSVRTEFGAGLADSKSPLGAIAAEDIAEIVAFLAQQPPQCFISEVLVRPTLKK